MLSFYGVMIRKDGIYKILWYRTQLTGMKSFLMDDSFAGTGRQYQDSWSTLGINPMRELQGIERLGSGVGVRSQAVMMVTAPGGLYNQLGGYTEGFFDTLQVIESLGRIGIKEYKALFDDKSDLVVRMSLPVRFD